MLLEFTLTSDFWPDSLSLAKCRKQDKVGYVNLQSDLHATLPGWNVRLLTFVLEDRGLFDEAAWGQNLDRLGLPPNKQRAFFELAVMGAYEVAEDILAVRKARLKILQT